MRCRILRLHLHVEQRSQRRRDRRRIGRREGVEIRRRAPGADRPRAHLTGGVAEALRAERALRARRPPEARAARGRRAHETSARASWQSESASRHVGDLKSGTLVERSLVGDEVQLRRRTTPPAWRGARSRGCCSPRRPRATRGRGSPARCSSVPRPSGPCAPSRRRRACPMPVELQQEVEIRDLRAGEHRIREDGDGVRAAGGARGTAAAAGAATRGSPAPSRSGSTGRRSGGRCAHRRRRRPRARPWSAPAARRPRRSDTPRRATRASRRRPASWTCTNTVSVGTSVSGDTLNVSRGVKAEPAMRRRSCVRAADAQSDAQPRARPAPSRGRPRVSSGSWSVSVMLVDAKVADPMRRSGRKSGTSASGSVSAAVVSTSYASIVIGAVSLP